MNNTTGAQRHNKRMDKVWTEAILMLQKYCKHEDFSDNLTGSTCNTCGLEFTYNPECPRCGREIVGNSQRDVGLCSGCE